MGWTPDQKRKSTENSYFYSVRAGSQRVDNEFSKRKPFYDIVNAEGDAGIARLSALVASRFQAQSLESTNWLLTHLRRRLIDSDPIRRARSEAAKEGAAKSAMRHLTLVQVLG